MSALASLMQYFLNVMPVVEIFVVVVCGFGGIVRKSFAAAATDVVVGGGGKSISSSSSYN